jgi:hypothetical protein
LILLKVQQIAKARPTSDLVPPNVAFLRAGDWDLPAHREDFIVAGVAQEKRSGGSLDKIATARNLPALVARISTKTPDRAEALVANSVVEESRGRRFSSAASAKSAHACRSMAMTSSSAQSSLGDGKVDRIDQGIVPPTRYAPML